MKTVQLIISGRVQGVFYRASAKEAADKMNIKGWVKNTKEGFVEILASGAEEQVTQFIEWCKKGPEKANVTNVQIISTPYQSFPTFQVIK